MKQLMAGGGVALIGITKQIVSLITWIIDTNQRDFSAFQTDFSFLILQHNNAGSFAYV